MAEKLAVIEKAETEEEEKQEESSFVLPRNMRQLNADITSEKFDQSKSSDLPVNILSAKTHSNPDRNLIESQQEEEEENSDFEQEEVESEAEEELTEVEVTDQDEDTEYSETDGNVTEIETEKIRSTPLTKPKLETVIVPSRFGPNMDISENIENAVIPARLSATVLTEEECKIAHRFSSSTSSESDTEGVTMVQEPNFTFRTIEAAEKLDRSRLSLNELELSEKVSFETTSSGSLDNLQKGIITSLDQTAYFGRNSRQLIESIENLDKHFYGPIGEAIHLDWNKTINTTGSIDKTIDNSPIGELSVEKEGPTSSVSIKSIEIDNGQHSPQQEDRKRRCVSDEAISPAEKVFLLTDHHPNEENREDGKAAADYIDKLFKYRTETARLVDLCQPMPVDEMDEPSFVLEESKDDEYAYDYNDLIMSMKEEGEDDLSVDAYVTDTIDDTEYSHDIVDKDSLSGEIYSPDGEELKHLQKIKPHTIPDCKSPRTSRSNSDESITESEHEIPRSPAMETPMKLFYHLVPSPHSSSNEESEVDDAQTANHYDVSIKSLSPIPECPSQEENVNTSLDSLYRNSKRGSCTSSFVSIESDNPRKLSVMDVDSPEQLCNSKEFMGSLDPYPTLIESLPPTKKDLRSLLEKFVAEQLRECESDDKPRSRLWSTQVVCQPLPVYPIQKTPEKLPCSSDLDTGDVMLPPLTPQTARAKLKNQRSPTKSLTTEQDIMLPPLKPETALSRSKNRSSASGSSEDESLHSLQSHRQSNSRLSRARVVRSSKVLNRTEQIDCRSDIVPLSGRNLRKHDMMEGDLSDSSLSAMTEPLNFDAVRKKLPQPLCHSTPKVYSTSVNGSHPSMIFLGTDEETKISKKSNPNIKEFETRNQANINSDVVEENAIQGQTNSVGSKSKIVRLTYCGSVLSNTEEESTPDLISSPDRPSSPLKILSLCSPTESPNIDKPNLEFLSIPPKSPYAPQDEFRLRYSHRRTPPKIVYRISGEFVPPSVGESACTVANDGCRVYRLSGEFAATIVSTSGSPTETVSSAIQALADSMAKVSNHRLSGDFVATVIAESVESLNPITSTQNDSQSHNTKRDSILSAVSSCRNSRCRSTELVWTTFEPLVSEAQLSADEQSVPDLPAADIKEEQMEQLKQYRLETWILRDSI